MIKLIQYIEDNFERFSDLDESEVLELDAHYMDNDIVEYLKDIQYAYGTDPKFTHKGICMYYVGESDEVWIENLNVD